MSAMEEPGLGGGVRQQLLRPLDGIGKFLAAFPAGGTLAFAHDKASPDGVVHPLGQQSPLLVEGRETHPVGMEREEFA